MHRQNSMAVNEDNTPYCSACIPEQNNNEDNHEATKSKIRRKYKRMMISKPMREFMKDSGTYEKQCKAMLYHTFLVVMLGLTVLAKSVEEEV